MSNVLAIDQSTSGTKAVLFDRTGRVLGIESRGHRQIYPQPGWVEHDAEEIWQNTVAVVRALIRRGNGSAKDLAGVSITNQRETCVVFDRTTGRPLHNAIVWQDRRGDPTCRRLEGDGHGPMVRGKTGLKIDAYFSATKLAWLVEEHPDLAACLASGEALIGTMDTYLVYRLTGGAVFATDHTNASRTLLFDIQRLRWDESLCALFKVPLRALAQVRESAAEFGTTDVEGALPARVPIRGVMGDSQASLFAQRCFQPGMTKATFGSGTSVLLNIGDTFRVAEGGAVTAVAWVIDGRPTYALEGLINYSAATVEWLKDQLGLIRDAAESEMLARSVEDNGGVYLVPAFAGLGAPHWSPDARAAILGMTAHTTKAHVVRAALESVAYQVRDVLEMMRSVVGVAPRMILGDGRANHE
jgi:glycerol kinase